jgi:hypothetical protein
MVALGALEVVTYLYDPSANMAKRKNRTLVEMAYYLLQAKDLLTNF